MFYILLITNLPQISALRSAKRNPNAWFTNPFPRVALKMPLGRSICRCGGMQGSESHYTSPSHHHHYLTPNHHVLLHLGTLPSRTVILVVQGWNRKNRCSNFYLTATSHNGHLVVCSNFI
ncbi:hypothetical protein Hanom_Chr02g00162281 [Helianthus anomalus]